MVDAIAGAVREALTNTAKHAKVDTAFLHPRRKCLLKVAVSTRSQLGVDDAVSFAFAPAGLENLVTSNTDDVPGVRLFRRKPPAQSGPTLAARLRELERLAEVRLTDADPPYSRALLAAETGTATRLLNSWLDGDHTPQDVNSLIRVVQALSVWAEQQPVDEPKWRALHADARRRRSVPEKRRLTRMRVLVGGLALAAAGTAINTIVGGAFSPFGQTISEWFGFSSTPATASPSVSQSAAVETLQASAAWCCHFTTDVGDAGFYWSGAPAGLASVLVQGGAAELNDLTPAGVGIIEIPLQASGTDPIYVAPPEVHVWTRSSNVKTGIIGILPLGGQGGGAPDRFETDLDAARPVTVPYSLGGVAAGSPSAPDYYYVSSASPEILLLVVRDTGCDCTFDVRLNWQAEGRSYSEVFLDGKQPFRMIGSTGLPWYSGDPLHGESLALTTGQIFPAG